MHNGRKSFRFMLETVFLLHTAADHADIIMEPVLLENSGQVLYISEQCKSRRTVKLGRI